MHLRHPVLTFYDCKTGFLDTSYNLVFSIHREPVPLFDRPLFIHRIRHASDVYMCIFDVIHRMCIFDVIHRMCIFHVIHRRRHASDVYMCISDVIHRMCIFHVIHRRRHASDLENTQGRHYLSMIRESFCNHRESVPLLNRPLFIYRICISNISNLSRAMSRSD